MISRHWLFQLILCVGMVCAACAGEMGVRVSIEDFGAKGNGRVFNTAAIQKAIDQVAQNGGGTVVVPEGVFLTGALFLKPGVNLHLEADAVLRGSTRIADYPKMRTRIEGHFEKWRPALINATGCDGLRITGAGTIEGSGQAFWQEFWRRLAANKKTKNLDVERPRLMFIADSHDVVICGVALRDSGFWHLHLYRCQDLLVDGIRINTPIGAPSTDGIDIDSCQRVTVRGCEFSVDDDCIAIKGSKGPDALADKDSPPVEHIRVENCRFRVGHGAVTLGSEATVVRDVVVEDCQLEGATKLRSINLLRFKLRPDTAQTYEDIHFKNITVSGFGRLISIAPWTQYFDLKGKSAPSATVSNISLSGITGSFTSFGQIKGHAKTRISDIRMENFDVRLEDQTLALGSVEKLSLQNMIVNGRPYDTNAAPAAEASPTSNASPGVPE